jgi:hypothetical protein
LSEDFETIYPRMRAAIPRPVHTRCPSLLLAETLRSAATPAAPPPIPYERIADQWNPIIKSA